MSGLLCTLYLNYTIDLNTNSYLNPCVLRFEHLYVQMSGKLYSVSHQCSATCYLVYVFLLLMFYSVLKSKNTVM